MKWGSTAASGSGLHAFQPSMSLEASSRKVHAHFFLNAPSGAGCLPTAYDRSDVNIRGRLNAPSGAGCLPTLGRRRMDLPLSGVSMHLLVPGAYRRGCGHSVVGQSMSLNAPSGAGCLPTSLYYKGGLRQLPSQCTFWCRVLTDRIHRPPSNPNPSLNAPSGAGCLPT